MRTITCLIVLGLMWGWTNRLLAQDAAALGRQLKDKDVNVRLKAVYALSQMGANARPALADLLESLNGTEDGLLTYTGGALAGIGKEAVPGVSKALQQKSSRRAAAHAMFQLGRDGHLVQLDQASIDLLAEQAKEKDYTSRVYSTKAMGYAGKPGVRGLAALLKQRDLDPEIRSLAAEAVLLAGADSEIAILALAGCLGDANLQVRMAASKTLGTIGQPAVPVLTDFLANKNENVRLHAAMGLAQMSAGVAQAAIPALSHAMKDKNELVRQQAATALGKVGPAAE